MIPFSSKSLNRYLAKKFFKGIFYYIKTLLWNAIALVFIWYIFGLNMKNIKHMQFYPPYTAHLIMAPFNMEQIWSMFSPAPPNYSWYYHIEATLDNGTTAELFANGGLFSWETAPFDMNVKPVVWIGLKNHRWFKYMENGVNSHAKNEQLRLHMARFICREFNTLHTGADRIHTFKLLMVTEVTDPYNPFAERQKRPVHLLWHHMCFEKPAAEQPTQDQQQDQAQAEQQPEQARMDRQLEQEPDQLQQPPHTEQLPVVDAETQLPLENAPSADLNLHGRKPRPIQLQQALQAEIPAEL